MQASNSLEIITLLTFTSNQTNYSFTPAYFHICLSLPLNFTFTYSPFSMQVLTESIKINLLVFIHNLLFQRRNKYFLPTCPESVVTNV